MKSRRIGWGTYNDWEKGKIDAGFSLENLREEDRCEDLGIDGRIMVK
jgi:hypothetical protein